MARADFNWMPFGHEFTANNPTFSVSFPIEGTRDPVDDAYLLITAHNVSNQSHQIFINDVALPGFDLPIHNPGWMTWMDHIQPGLLRLGTNTLRVVRAGGDDFTTKDAVVHWRE